MSWWRRLLGREAKSSGNWFFQEILQGSKTSAGVSVTATTAMQLSAVWACVTVRSEDIAKLPVHLYRRTKDGGKERAIKHPVYRLLDTMPNPRNTAFEFKQMLQMQCDLRGNAYALKEVNGRGQVTALWPLQSDKVEVLEVEDGRELMYKLTDKKGKQTVVPAEDIFHLRGNSMDGIVGMSPIAWHRETIGHAIGAEKYGASFFGNSAQPSGALVMPQKMSAEAAAKLRSDWKERFQGPENAHNLAIFDGGMDWKQIGMTNADAQFIETRKYQNSEIYRIYRMPPHRVQDLDRATNNNIEHQGLEYVEGCLLSIFERWQQALDRDLLLPDERGEYFFEFLPDALLRGDVKSRYEAYTQGVLNGWLSPNDVRDRENMNRVKGGDQYFRPMNVQPLDAPPPPEPAPAPAPKGKRPPKEPA